MGGGTQPQGSSFWQDIVKTKRAKAMKAFTQFIDDIFEINSMALTTLFANLIVPPLDFPSDSKDSFPLLLE